MKQIFKKTNRFLAAFLAVAMIVTMLPISTVTAWAALGDGNTVTISAVTSSDIAGVQNNSFATALAEELPANAEGYSANEKTYTHGAGTNLYLRAQLSAGYKGATITNSGAGVGSITPAVDTAGVLTASVINKTIEGLNNSDAITLEIGSAVPAIQKVVVNSTTTSNGNTVASIGGVTENLTNDGKVVAVAAVDGATEIGGGFDIVVTPKTGYTFTSDAIDPSKENCATAVANAGSATITLKPKVGSTNTSLGFTVDEDALGTGSSHADRTLTFTISGDALDGPYTGAITKTNQTKSFVKTDAFTGGKLSITGLSGGSGTASFKVKPSTGDGTEANTNDYVLALGNFTLTDSEGDPVALTQSEENTGFGGRDAETTYSFTAVPGAAYTLTTKGVEKPKLSDNITASGFTVTGDAISSGDYLKPGTNSFTLTGSGNVVTGIKIDASGEGSTDEAIESNVAAMNSSFVEQISSLGGGAGTYTFDLTDTAKELGLTYALTVTTEAVSNYITVTKEASSTNIGGSGVNAGTNASITFTAAITPSDEDWTPSTWELYDGSTLVDPATLFSKGAKIEGNTYTLSGTLLKACSALKNYTVKAYNEDRTLEGSCLLPYYVETVATSLHTRTQNTPRTYDNASKTYKLTEESTSGEKVYLKNARGDGRTIIIKGFDLDGTDKAAFSVTSPTVPASGLVVDDGEVLEVTVTPDFTVAKEAKDGGYNATLLVKSDMFTANREVALLNLTIDNDIAVAVNGTEHVNTNMSTPSGGSWHASTGGDIDLGTYKVGEVIGTRNESGVLTTEDVTLQASGSVSGLTWTRNGTDALLATDLPDGITVSASSNGAIVFSGAPTARAYRADTGDIYMNSSDTVAINAVPSALSTAKAAFRAVSGDVPAAVVYYIPLTVKDKNGNSVSYTGIMTVTAADLSYSIGEDALTNAGNYEWFADTSANAKRTLTIKNNGTKTVTVTASLTSATNLALSNTSAVDITGGGTATIDITNATGNTDTGAVLTVKNASNLGVDSFTQNLKFTKVSALTITDPYVAGGSAASDPATGLAVGENAELGNNFSFQFKAQSTSDAAITWEIARVATDLENTKTPNGTTATSVVAGTAAGYTAINTDAALLAYGLQLMPDGTLTGVPVQSGKLELAVRVSQTVSGVTSNVVGYYLLNIAAGEGSVTLKDASGTIISSENGITRSMKINQRTEKVAITIENKSAEKISNITVDSTDDSVAQEEYQTGDTKFDLAANTGSYTFYLNLKSNAAAGKYSATISLSSGVTPFMTFPVSVTVTSAPVITAATVGGSYDIGDAISEIVLTAATPAGASLKGGTWSWEPATSEDTLPAGLTLNGSTGKINGTPTTKGTYNVAVIYTHTDGTTGEKTLTFVITGTKAVSVLNGATDLITTYPVTGTNEKPYIFDGVVAGAAAGPSALNVTIQNDASGTTAANAVSGVTVKITDSLRKNDEGALFTGSAEKFTLSSTTGTLQEDGSLLFASIPGGKRTVNFDIVPNDFTNPGTYRADVTVNGGELAAAKSFVIQYTVAPELTVDSAASGALDKAVGDILSFALKATGAGAKYTDGAIAGSDDNGQIISWALIEKDADGELSTTELTKKYNELYGTAGITSIASAAGTTRAITGGANATVAAANGLKTIGEYSFTVRATAAAASQATDTGNEGAAGAGTARKVPAQTADRTFTLKVGKTGKVYVIDSTTKTSPAAWNAGTAESILVSSGSTKKYVTSYEFNELAAGKYTVAGATERFYVANDMTKTDTKVTATLEGEDKDFFTISPTTETTVAKTSETTFFTVAPKNTSLAVKEYAVNLVITGNNINTITIPLKLKVNELSYGMEIKKGQETQTGTLTLDPVIKSGSASATEFVVKNAGNVSEKFRVTEVKDANGTGFGTSTGKKLSVKFKTANAATTNALASGKTPGSDTLQITPTSVAEEGVQTAYIKLEVLDGQSSTAIDEQAQVLTVDYTVLSNDVKGVTLSPTGSVDLGSAEENYGASEYSAVFTVSNGSDAGEQNALSNVKVTLTDSDNFEISGKTLEEGGEVYGVKILASGESESFTVTPVKGLSAGTYSTRINVTAANMKTTSLSRIISFKVTASAEYSVNASTAGVEITQSYGERLMKTLKALAALADERVTENTAYSNNTSAAKYTLNLNKSTETITRNDVEVELANNSGWKFTVKKLGTCNVTKSANELDYSAGVAGTTFSKVTFNILETVTVDLDDTDTAKARFLDEDGETLLTWDDWMGGNATTIIYQVPYGSSLAEIEGAVTEATKHKTVTGLPVIEGGVSNPANTEMDLAIESWYDSDTRKAFYNTTPVTKDKASTIDIQWHEHSYPEGVTTYDGKLEDGSIPEGIEWHWEGTEEDNYTGTYVTVTCMLGNDCPDENKGLVKIVATVALGTTDPTCTEKGGKVYTATAGAYKDIKNLGETAAVGHTIVFDTEKVVWSEDYTSATISWSCTSESHDVDKDGEKSGTITTTAITKEAKDEATCVKAGSVEYTATFSKELIAEKIKDYAGNAVSVKSGTIEGQLGEHDYTGVKPTFAWTKSTEGGAPSVTAYLVCKNSTEESHRQILEVPEPTVGKDGKTYSVSITYDGKQYNSSYNVETGKQKETTGGGEGIVIEGLEESYMFTGAAIKPYFTVVDYDRDGIVLALGTDYSVSYKDNTKVGTAKVTITGKGNYTGKTYVVNFAITDPMKDVDTKDLIDSVKKIEKISESFTFDGEPKYPATITVTPKTGSAVVLTGDGSGSYTTDGDKTAVITVANNVNKGSATITAFGADGKAVKATFKIAVVDLSKASEDDLKIEVEAAPYAVKGAKASVAVSYKGLELVEGQDYTVAYGYKDKKNAGENAGSVTITGKGNFTKKASAKNFTIEKYELTDDSLVSIGAYAGVAPKSIKAIVTDGTGVVIPAKSYKVKVEKDGEDISTSKDKLAAGDTIDITIEPAGGENDTNLTGSVSITGYVVAENLSKAKVTIAKTFTKTYTGEAIELEDEDFESNIKVSLKINKVDTPLEYGTDYEIAGYQNNVKKGTMTVYIRGISEKCSGTKTFKVKIAAKEVKKAAE